MAITKNLVDAMGGTIDVESELGQESSFEVLMNWQRRFRLLL